MAVGLKIWHPVTGVLILDVTDRVHRRTGSVFTGTTAGSLTIPGVDANNQGWFTAINAAPGDTTFAPKITISGATLSWSWDPGYTPANTLIQYGVR